MLCFLSFYLAVNGVFYMKSYLIIYNILIKLGVPYFFTIYTQYTILKVTQSNWISDTVYAYIFENVD